jgi:hypothetical protein
MRRLYQPETKWDGAKTMCGIVAYVGRKIAQPLLIEVSSGWNTPDTIRQHHGYR